MPLADLPTRTIQDVPSLIASNRLESRPRSTEFNRTLRAEVRDAAWMLARQWQLKEFRAEDRGLPVVAEVELEHSRLNQFRLGNKTIVQFDEQLLPRPLDALVQAQFPVIDPGLQLQMGHYWERLLRAENLADTLLAFRAAYPLLAPEPPTSGYSLDYGVATTTPEALEILQVIGELAINGEALYQDVRVDKGKAADAAGVSRSSPTGQALISLAERFKAWYGRLYALPTADEAGAWSVPDLEYQFEAAAPTVDGQPITLEGREHTGGELSWYSMDENPTLADYDNTPDVAKRETLRFVPTEIQFGGGPNARWWEFEDRQVDFGKITGDTSDLGRMLLQEFMFLYQNDWFSLPYTVPAGSICSVVSIYVTDVFGQRHRIQPAGYSSQHEPKDASIAVDMDWGRWSMYALSQRGDRKQSVPRLLLPPTATALQVGKPVEQVLLQREEATNLVWGVEQTISNGLGRGMDGAGAAARLTEYLRSLASTEPAPPALAKLEYQLSTPVAEHWIPFVPRPGATTDEYELIQGEMVRLVPGLDPLNAGDETVLPRTSLLLLNADSEYLLREHTVPSTGVRVDAAFRRTRWYNGATVLWYGRSLGPGRSAGGSGLAYDQLLPRTVRTEPDQFGLYAAVTTAGLVDRVRLHPFVSSAVVGNTYLEKTRAQLISMLRAQDEILLITAAGNSWTSGVALKVVTVGTDTFIRPSTSTDTTTTSDIFGTTLPGF